jgi:MFS family permease
MMNTNRLSHTFRALRSRDFSLFWAGQWISVTGTWMQSMALSWLMYRITSSPFALGLLVAARMGPSLVGAPFAGVVADHFQRRTVVILTQASSLVLATILGLLTLAGSIQVWHILLLSLFQGCVDTLDMTARQTFQMDIVGPEDLQSAVALNSAAFNAGRLVGPLMAGLVLHFRGEGSESWCFLFNSVSYLAVLISLFMIRTKPQIHRELPQSLLENIREGLRYVWRTGPVRERVLAIGITSTVGLSIYSLLPVFARDVLHSGSRGYSLLLAGGGVGAMIGALVAASGSKQSERSRVHAYSLLALGFGLAAMGITRTLGLSMLWLLIVGIAVGIQMARTNVFLQTTAPEHLRGRVVSIYIWVFSGLMPLGSLGAGWMAEHTNAAVTSITGGILCVLAGIVFLLRRRTPAAHDKPDRTSHRPYHS